MSHFLGEGIEEAEPVERDVEQGEAAEAGEAVARQSQDPVAAEVKLLQSFLQVDQLLLPYIPPAFGSIVYNIYTLHRGEDVNDNRATARYFYGTFVYEICFYGIYFYGIYIYGIYFYRAVKFVNYVVLL